MKDFRVKYKKAAGGLLFILLLALAGCGKAKEMEEVLPQKTVEVPQPQITEENIPPQLSANMEKEEVPEAITEEMDWAEYFDGLNGAAVFYDPSRNQYRIYNMELSEVRRSPCSTFKIISSLAGLEEGVIKAEASKRKWSGEIFWKEDWNRDIDFVQAFQTSCIWYFREVINDLGPEKVEEELNRLEYGNCDISDWEGRANTNNNNRALTGFWVEASLKISAREQAEVMDRIFNKKVKYHEDTLDQLRKAMLIEDQTLSSNPVYGKTGLGMDKGIVVDSWFTGFVDTDEGLMTFCVYIGRTDGMEVSSKKAKEIAIRIAADSYNSGGHGPKQLTDCR